MIGSTLSHYRILERLGAGGMGEVFVAEDTKLNRRVALKVLPPHLAGQPERLVRFQREAESVAALSHPNIVTIFSVEEDRGVHFLTMELIEGEDLGDLIPPSGLALKQLLDLGVQISDALAAAHEAGVIHRDLKPSNIMVDKRGNVRMMDFGLAKLQATADVEASDAPTEALTREGTQLGTVPYMAPEQVQGKTVDHRADIFALGVVLYEMAIGRRPFRGESAADVMSAILRDDPEPLAESRADLPRQFDRILRHCLEKSPDRRFQTAADLRNELQSLTEELTTDTEATSAPSEGTGSRQSLRWFLVAGGVLGLLAVLWLVRGRSGSESETVATSRPGPVQRRVSQLTLADELDEWPAWSPDGSRLIYSGEAGGFLKLFVRDAVSGDTEQLTDGFGDDLQAAWSPDGRSVVFVRASSETGKIDPDDLFGNFWQGGDIWRLDLESGEPVRLVENAYSPTWSPDGEKLAFHADWVGSSRIWTSDARGRNPRQVTIDSSEAVDHVEPSFSPDGEKIVYRRREKSKSDLQVVDLTSGAISWLTDDDYRDLNPQWTPDGGAIVFSSYRGGGQNLWRQPVGAGGEPIGDAEQLTTGAGNDVQLSISPDGARVAFSVLGINSDIWRLPVDPSSGLATGPPKVVVSTSREDSRPAPSPDGKLLAFNSDRQGDMNIWVRSLEDGSDRQVTSGPGGDFQPTWSPDGKRLAFFSSRGGNLDIWTVEIETGELRQLTDDAALDEDAFFSPDGEVIAYQSDRDGRLELWAMQSDGEGSRKLGSRKVSGHFMRWQDDGSAVFVRSEGDATTNLFRQPVSGGEAEPMPKLDGAGFHISFSPDRRTIMDVSGHQVLWAYPAAGGERTKVFEFEDPDIRIDYPVWSADGRWVYFDRADYSGADLWLLEEVEGP